MHYIVNVLENTPIYELPHPYVYEGKKGFIIIDYTGVCVFVNSSTYKSVEHLFDKAETLE